MEPKDRLTECLLSNGDLVAVSDQALYEYAWVKGIRPINESLLKPAVMTKARRIEKITIFAEEVLSGGCC